MAQIVFAVVHCTDSDILIAAWGDKPVPSGGTRGIQGPCAQAPRTFTLSHPL